MSDTQQQNTVHSTAQQTLHMLAAAGNSDAKMLIKNMGIDNSAMMKTGKAANNESFLSPDERKYQSNLKKHGGMWVTSDPEVKYDAIAAANMDSPEGMALYTKARSNIKKNQQYKSYQTEFAGINE